MASVKAPILPVVKPAMPAVVKLSAAKQLPGVGNKPTVYGKKKAPVPKQNPKTKYPKL